MQRPTATRRYGDAGRTNRDRRTKRGRSASVAGQSFPLGATVVEGGVNFCTSSRHASAIELLLFAGACDAEPSRVIRLDAPIHRTYHYWHAFVPDLRAGQVYAYRAVGAFDPARDFGSIPRKISSIPIQTSRHRWGLEVGTGA
jgi:pullulanase/glycogen debranching enzyme